MTSQGFPQEFISMLKELLGHEAEQLLDSLQEAPSTAIRKNQRKPADLFPGKQSVPWCENGIYLDKRPVFTTDPLFHAGAYYVQDPSSMIYETLARKISKELQGENEDAVPLKVLDLCAAPGGKTTALINGLPDGSFIHANEFVAKRVPILKENLVKWGYPNYTVTNFNTAVFSVEESFDIVAVDAPCSGEGMMRKDQTAIEQWSMKLVNDCAALQKEILKNAVKAVKPGGFLIYSTCTFNRFENEENAEFIFKEGGLIPYDPVFPQEWGIPGGINTDLPLYRFMPHKTKGEGLFLAVFRKEGEWRQSFMHASGKKRVAPRQKSSNEEGPDIEDILSINFDKTTCPRVELSEKDALTYLRRESLKLPEGTPKGPVVVTYKGLALGPAKNIGSRANNLYPKNWRIKSNKFGT